MEVNARVAHSSPGRLRLKLDRADFETSNAADTADAFRSLDGVLAAQLNAPARSIVVHYDERSTDPDRLTEDLLAAGVKLRFEAEAQVTVAGAPVLSAKIAGAAERADQRVLAISGGSADLRTLVPITLGVLAAREILSGRGTSVPWYALAWYAFDSFAKLRRRSNASSDPD